MSDLKSSPSADIETYEEATGTSYESMLITTDSFEEFSQELSASLDDDTSIVNKAKSIINEIRDTSSNTENITSASSVIAATLSSAATTTNNGVVTSSEKVEKELTRLSAGADFGSQDLLDQDTDGGGNSSSDDYLHDDEWLNEKEHVFVLSSAGKPIYSLHGNEDKLATLCGVMQALVSVVHANQDTIISIHAVGFKFVFLVKGPLILVAASRRNLSVQQIQLQLT